MHWSERRERFRVLIEGKRCVYPGSVFDPISSRIAEELGFEVLLVHPIFGVRKVNHLEKV